MHAKITPQPPLGMLCHRLAPKAVGAFAAMAVTMVMSAATTAEAAVPQLDGSKARVNLSSQLRSLTEDITAATCRIKAQIEVPSSIADLVDAHDTFETILTGLRQGDARLGMRMPEQRGSLINRMDLLRDQWAPIAASVADIAQGTSDAQDFDVILGAHAAMLELTENLAAAVSGVYSDPVALLQRDAVTLNVLSRQRSLALRLARSTCGILTGDDALGTPADLEATIDMFDVSYQALINGYPSAGVSPPPSDAVAQVLSEAYEDWRAAQPSFNAASNDMAAVVQQAAVFADATVRQIDNAMTLYMIASPGQKDVFQSSLEAYADSQLIPWLEAPEVITALRAQNAAHAGMSEAEVIALDDAWRAEAKGGSGNLIRDTLARPLSQWLKDKQIGTAGIVTEVFVMDNLGLNVGQSVQTSDYWQGDETKWQATFGAANPEMHVGELEFDESTRSYQTQASQLIVDPATGEPLGAVTFGINVINLM